MVQVPHAGCTNSIMDVMYQKGKKKKTKQKRNGQRGHGAINMIASKSASKEL